MSIWWRSNQAIGLYLLLMFGALFAYIWMQPWAHRVMRDGFLLGMMPMLGIGLMSICALAMVFDPMRREQPEGLQGIRASDAWLPIVMLVGVAVCFWAMSWLGFILAASPFLLVFMLWFGFRPVRLAFILAVVVPVIVFAFFTLLGVRLPRGVIAGFF